jgi:hypothetical protein
MQLQVDTTSEQLLAGREWDEQVAVQMHVQQSASDPDDSETLSAMPTEMLDTMHLQNASMSEQLVAGQDQDEQETFQIQARQSDSGSEGSSLPSASSTAPLDTMSSHDDVADDRIMAEEDQGEQMASQQQAQRFDPVVAGSVPSPRTCPATRDPPNKAATGRAVLKRMKRKHHASRRTDAPP